MMYSVYLLLAAILCSTALAENFQSDYYKDCGRGPNYPLRSKRIASGRNAVPNSWPSMVKLEFTSPYQPDENSIESSTCGGTLLDHHHILTAAHCIDTTNGVPNIDAYLGVHDDDAEKGFVKRRIARYWRKVYDPKNKIDDIAILRMETPVKFNDVISPVCLPQGNDVEKDFTNATVTVIGWGRISDFSEDTSSVLKQGNLKITSKKLCKEHFFDEDRYFPEDQILCAISPDLKTKYLQGDSGGPMFYQRSKGSPWIQIGIMSYKSQDTDKLENPEKFSYGGIVTRVAYYLDVIRKQIRNLENMSRG